MPLFSTDNSRIQQVYSPTCFDWISRTDQDENVHSWQNNYFLLDSQEIIYQLKQVCIITFPTTTIY